MQFIKKYKPDHIIFHVCQCKIQMEIISDRKATFVMMRWNLSEELDFGDCFFLILKYGIMLRYDTAV